MEPIHNTVYIRRAAAANADEVAAAVEEIFAALPAAARLTPQSRVLLKPNLLAKHAPDAGVTTHPHVVRGVICALQKRRVTDITVADSPGGPYTPEGMRGIYAACGVAAVCEELGAKLYTACESGAKPAAGGTGRLVQEFTFIRPALDCDFIINLPKMKTHVMTYMSGAVKNLFGLVPGLQKAEFHMRFPQKEHFGRMLVDLCETAAADMHIVDGGIAMQGDGPSGGDAREANLVLGGTNPYTLDLALCHIMGLDAMQAPMLRAAADAGLCGEAIDMALLNGPEDAKQPLPAWQPPRSFSGDMSFLESVPGFLRPLMPTLVKYVAPRPVVNKAACVGCGKCAEICPQNVIRIQNKKAYIAYRECIRCFCCHEMCPVKAMDVKRRRLFGM